MKRKLSFWVVGIAILLIGLSFAAFDGGNDFLESFMAYAISAAMGGLVCLPIFLRSRNEEHPGWLVPALLGALTFRLVLAVLLYRGLPVLGYDTQIQNAGYVFADAFARDGDAWELVASGGTIGEILLLGGGNDQYGGLLTLSALLYKVFSPDAHRPLMIAILSATFSTLAVYYAWKFARAVFGNRAAAATFAVMALYPDAVLLGASQMREPFIMAGIAIAFYGYSRLRAEGIRPAILPILSGLGLAVLFSPPMAVLSIVVLAGARLIEQRRGVRLPGWVVIVAVVVLAGAFILTSRAWSSISGSPEANPFQMVWWWLTEGARYQMYVLEKKSGIVQLLFEYAPDWAHAPLATLYGLVQPFFPAAVMDISSPAIWRAISIWRAAGWFVLLPYLLYAPLAALRAKGWRHLATYFAIAAWLLAAFVSYRAAGDQWDNPRYRATFLLVFAVVTGWAGAWAHDTGSRWLRHTVIIVGGVTVLFLQWYAGRYLHLPSLELFPTIALIAGIIPVYLGLAWLFEQRRG